MKRHLILIIAAVTALLPLIAIAPDSFAAPKRIAVLYFDDHSRFDSPTGCGCIPGPVGKIFGGGRTKNRWKIKAGFTELLSQKLKFTKVYDPVPQDEIIDAMSGLGLSKKDIEASAEKRSALAKELKVDSLIVGDIRKFNQERARANAARTLRESGRDNRGRGSFVGGVQVLGYLYFTSVKLDLRFYGLSGNEIAKSEITAGRRHQLGGAQVAALTAIVSEQGTEIQLGQTAGPKKIRPIVDPERLNEIEFGSADYYKTLLGITTNEAMDKCVLAAREHIGPNFVWPPNADETAEGESTQASPPTTLRTRGPIIGKVAHVNAENPEEIYINIGSAKGVVIGHRMVIYRQGEPIKDPDTGEILDYIYQKIGRGEVADVQSAKVSKLRVFEGVGEVKTGDSVRVETAPRSVPRSQQ